MKERPLRTTVIGSYPFPGWLEFASQHLAQFGPDDVAEAQDDAVICAIHDQVAAGLDVITDGEQTRLDFNLSFYGYLEGIDLEVADGQTLALLGANGSGKTTLVRALLGLVPPTRGRIAVYGADLAMRRTVPWSRVGYVPQRVNAQPGMSVTAEEVVAAGLLDHRRLTPGPPG